MALKLFIKRFLGHCRASGHCARHVSTELATPQPQMGVGGRLFSLRCQGGFLSFLCPYTKKLCPVHRPQNCPWEAVNAETRYPQPILSCFDNGDRRKGCPTQKPQEKTCSLFMFLPQLLKGSLQPEPRRRKEQTNAPPQGRTSPRWCSCSGWRARTPRRCRGSPCWSTCPLDAQVSTSTGAVKRRESHTNAKCVTAGLTGVPLTKLPRAAPTVCASASFLSLALSRTHRIQLHKNHTTFSPCGFR